MNRTTNHPGALHDLDDITASWLTAALRHVGLDTTITSVGIDRVVDDSQQQLVRLLVASSGPDRAPASMMAKLAPPDRATRRRIASTGQAEVRFYRELASTVGVRTPECLFASEPDAEGHFTLLFEDLAGLDFPGQLAGCTPEQLGAAVEALGALQGPRWCDPSLGRLGWLDSHAPDAGDRYAALYRAALSGFRARLVDRIDVGDVRMLRRIGDAIGPWATARSDRFSILHGDYRLGRLGFDPTTPDGAPTVVDWRMSSIGLPARDLSYFLATTLPCEDRRLVEAELVEKYHESLVANGVSGYGADECWDDYRSSAIGGAFITVLCGAMAPSAQDRDEVSLVMLSRTLDAVRDLDALDLL